MGESCSSHMWMMIVGSFGGAALNTPSLGDNQSRGHTAWASVVGFGVCGDRIADNLPPDPCPPSPCKCQGCVSSLFGQCNQGLVHGKDFGGPSLPPAHPTLNPEPPAPVPLTWLLKLSSAMMRPWSSSQIITCMGGHTHDADQRSMSMDGKLSSKLTAADRGATCRHSPLLEGTWASSRHPRWPGCCT